jgi:hypothetical protein
VPGLVPGIQPIMVGQQKRTWLAGTSPTEFESDR